MTSVLSGHIVVDFEVERLWDSDVVEGGRGCGGVVGALWLAGAGAATGAAGGAATS